MINKGDNHNTNINRIHYLSTIPKAYKYYQTSELIIFESIDLYHIFAFTFQALTYVQRNSSLV